MSEYKYLSANPKIRETAFQLYSEIKDLPIICPHGHVDPRILANNEFFPNPTELIIQPDHYIFRMLYSQGIPLERLGIPTVDGTEVEKDPKKIWQLFADNYFLFAGTPSGVWFSSILKDILNIHEVFNVKNALEIYSLIENKLSKDEYLPRALFDKFKIEVLSTTDSASDSLIHHKKINESDWEGKVIPCFRPDAVINILNPNWKKEIENLSKASNIDVLDFKSFISALENRREFFKSMGTVSTDQGLSYATTQKITNYDADLIFQSALKGEATEENANLFTSAMVMEMARMSVDDGMVMQLHPGSYRNHNKEIFNKFGADKGADIPIRTEYTRNLHELLNTYGNNPKFKLIVFTLDESTYTGELAPLAGHYPAMKLGPSWWFHDSMEGMMRYRRSVTETAGFYNTVGFNDDTRAFLSIPVRHDLARRMDANYLAELVEREIVSIDDAKILMYELTNGLVKKAYNL